MTPEEIARLRQTLTEASRLAVLAQRAARKVNVERMRGAAYPYEYIALADEANALSALNVACKNALETLQ